jgi:hypothetical protein
VETNPVIPGFYVTEKKAAYRRAEALPLWVYIVSGLTALAVVFLALWWLG